MPAETITSHPAIAISVTSSSEQRPLFRTRRPRLCLRNGASRAFPGRLGSPSSHSSSSARPASAPVRAAFGCDSPPLHPSKGSVRCFGPKQGIPRSDDFQHFHAVLSDPPANSDRSSCERLSRRAVTPHPQHSSTLSGDQSLHLLRFRRNRERTIAGEVGRSRPTPTLDERDRFVVSVE